MKKLMLFGLLAFTLSFTFKSKKFSKQTSYVFVPSGSMEIDTNKITCNAFYMSSTEVTNAQYREFINELKAEGDLEKLKIAVPDTTLWLKAFEHNYFEAFSNHYFWHPAYDNYPVVNVSKEAANLYCIWLTKKMRQQFPEQNFNDFRLPTKYEWIYAAKGGLELSPYPWGGTSTMNSKGCYMANYAQVGDQNIVRDDSGKVQVVSGKEWLHNGFGEYQILAPSTSYQPNGYGLYNMSGNCAEMLAKSDEVMGGSWISTGGDIRVTSSDPYEGADPTIGFRPVVTYVKID